MPLDNFMTMGPEGDLFANIPLNDRGEEVVTPSEASPTPKQKLAENMKPGDRVLLPDGSTDTITFIQHVGSGEYHVMLEKDGSRQWDKGDRIDVPND